MGTEDEHGVREVPSGGVERFKTTRREGNVQREKGLFVQRSRLFRKREKKERVERSHEEVLRQMREGVRKLVLGDGSRAWI